MKRQHGLTVSLVVALLFAALVQGAGVVRAVDTPRLPTSAADWTTFTPGERDAALSYEWTQFQALLASGSIHATSVTQSGVTQSGGGRLAPLVTATYSCQVQWYNVPEGSYVRGGGWTDTSANVYYQYASRPGLQGQFLRDGSLKSNWWSTTYNGSHAENWTGYDFKWWFEHPNYVTKGWHGAELSNGTWILGPDQYCTASASP